MVTDRYQHVEHHSDPAGLLDLGLPIIGIDNIEGSTAIERRVLPRACVLLFGQEGPGLSDESLDLCQEVLHITQYGSTSFDQCRGRRRDRHVRLGAAAPVRCDYCGSGAPCVCGSAATSRLCRMYS